MDKTPTSPTSAYMLLHATGQDGVAVVKQDSAASDSFHLLLFISVCTYVNLPGSLFDVTRILPVELHVYSEASTTYSDRLRHIWARPACGATCGRFAHKITVRCGRKNLKTKLFDNNFDGNKSILIQ
jgi:hypothetical protein